jgi:hypothetical protein
MINYNNLTISQLLDLLAKKTKQLSEFIAHRQFKNEEYLECRSEITKIQKTIEQKQKDSGDVSKMNTGGFNIAI